MMCVIATADHPEKHKVLLLCEGEAQEASMLSRMRGGSSRCLCSGQKKPLHVAIDISTPVNTSWKKKKKST